MRLITTLAILALSAPVSAVSPFDYQTNTRSPQLPSASSPRPTTVYRSDGTWSQYRNNNLGGGTVQHSNGQSEYIQFGSPSPYVPYTQSWGR